MATAIGKTKLSMVRDINGYPVNYFMGLPFADENQDLLLAVDTISRVTVPATLVNGQYLALITYSDGCDVFCLPANSPDLTIPSTTRSTLAQFRPSARLVVPGQVLQFLYHDTDVADRAVNVSISYYAISTNNFIG